MTEEVSKQEFSLGDMVLHRTWHIGYVVDVETGDNPDIIIDFPNAPNHRMSMRLARQALTKLPSDGLEALMSRQPDMIEISLGRGSIYMPSVVAYRIGQDTSFPEVMAVGEDADSAGGEHYCGS